MIVPSDPGWRLSPVAVCLSAIFPGRYFRGSTVLQGLRTIWLGAVIQLVASFGIVASLAEGGGDGEGWFIWVVLGLGVESLALSLWARRRPLTGESLEDLAVSARAWFFFAYAIGLGPALMGFVGAFVSDKPIAVLVIGHAFAAASLALGAPTAAAIRRREPAASAAPPSRLLSAMLMHDSALRKRA